MIREKKTETRAAASMVKPPSGTAAQPDEYLDLHSNAKKGKKMLENLQNSAMKYVTS